MRGSSRDNGETLVEILLTLVMLGLAVTAIMFALATTVHVGSFNRTQGKAAATLGAAAEYVRQAGWKPCDSWTSTNLSAAQVPGAADFTVAVEGPENGTGVPAGANPWSGITCSSGLEAVKVTVSGTGNSAISVSTIVALYCHKPVSGGNTCPA